ncbi:MAG TPA: hypothetical protein PKM88_00500 [bacterium]|nr:hypothetical protein [bacterium]
MEFQTVKQADLDVEFLALTPTEINSFEVGGQQSLLVLLPKDVIGDDNYAYLQAELVKVAETGAYLIACRLSVIEIARADEYRDWCIPIGEPGAVRFGGGWSDSRVGFKFTVPVVRKHRDKYGQLTKGNDLCVCNMTEDGGCDVRRVVAPQGSVYTLFASIAELIDREQIA